jgi:H-type small acid-soluble spore protein
MDNKRVQQIIESHGVIAVNYHDSPVWIEQIKNQDEAEVTILDNNQRMEVPIEQLIESDPTEKRAKDFLAMDENCIT